MVRERIPEGESIEAGVSVYQYDRFTRFIVKQHWFLFLLSIRLGLNRGRILDIGAGPGNFTIKLAKLASKTSIIGIDQSPEMVEFAKSNADKKGLSSRIDFLVCKAERLPFPDNSFSGIFSTYSLHHWISPQEVFLEIVRVLEPGGVFLIMDLRRDMNPVMKWAMTSFISQPLGNGLRTSIEASYTVNEIVELLTKSKLKEWTVMKHLYWIAVQSNKIS